MTLHALPGASVKFPTSVAGALFFTVTAVVVALRSMSTTSPAEPVDPSPLRPPDIDIDINITEEVRHLLDAAVVLDSGDYRIARAYRQDIVEGLNGTWYELDLRDAKKQHSLLFPPGRYAQREYEERFHTVMSRVQSEILKPGVNYRLYVRGSADILADEEPYIDSLMNGRPLTVRFLKKKPSNPNVYLNADSVAIVPVRYTNRDLPNLRGDYIRQRLKDQNPNSSVTLLDGGVSDRVSEGDRNAKIFLFLPRTASAPR